MSKLSDKNNMTVNEKLKYLRLKRCLTQKQAAELLGIDRSTYIRWEMGKCKKLSEKDYSALL